MRWTVRSSIGIGSELRSLHCDPSRSAWPHGVGDLQFMIAKSVAVQGHHGGSLGGKSHRFTSPRWLGENDRFRVGANCDVRWRRAHGHRSTRIAQDRSPEPTGHPVDLKTLEALDDCSRGKTASATPMLDKGMCDAKITPPGGGEFKQKISRTASSDSSPSPTSASSRIAGR